MSHPDNIVEADFEPATNKVHVSALNVAAAETEVVRGRLSGQIRIHPGGGTNQAVDGTLSGFRSDQGGRLHPHHYLSIQCMHGRLWCGRT